MNKRKDILSIVIASLIFISFWILLEAIRHSYILYRYQQNGNFDLTNIGALLIGLFITIIIAILIWKIQKGHAERLAKISQSIVDVYTYPTNHYAVIIKYQYVEKYNDAVIKKALRDSANLVDSLTTQGKSFKDIPIPGKTTIIKEIEFEKGTLRAIPQNIKLPRKNNQAEIVYLRLITDNFELLDEIITKNKLVYHNLEWYTAYSYPIGTIMKTIKTNTENLDVWRLEIEDDTEAADNNILATTYDLITIDQIKIDVAISQHKMSLGCSVSGTKRGFYRAHKILKPETIISMLFGKIGKDDTKKLLRDTLKPEID